MRDAFFPLLISFPALSLAPVIHTQAKVIQMTGIVSVFLKTLRLGVKATWPLSPFLFLASLLALARSWCCELPQPPHSSPQKSTGLLPLFLGLCSKVTSSVPKHPVECLQLPYQVLINIRRLIEWNNLLKSCGKWLHELRHQQCVADNKEPNSNRPKQRVF